MFPTTSRNIALISPMRQRLNALSGASSFAEKIIEKYSKTEPFPFSGEALVFLKALGDKLKEEEAVRDNVSYTLKLLIVHRLLVDGKIADPTAAKSLVESVKQSISQNISYLRKTDNNAYLRMIDARSYINSAADLGEIIRTENKSEKDREYIYSFVDTQILNDRFFGSDSKSYAYSGVYNRMPAHDLIYKKEKVDEETKRIGDLLLSDVPENVVNVGDTNYKYDKENLTYKTDDYISESTEVGGEQTVNNYAGDVNQGSNTVINAGETNQVSNTVVNTGDENYRYDNESLTYKTENNVSESTEVGGEQTVNNYAGDVNQGSKTVINAGETNQVSNTVVNAGDENYRYENESLTYKTENNVSESTEVGGEQTVENYAGDVNQGSNTVINAGETNQVSNTVVNTGDENYRYENESLTYKTENNVSEKTEVGGEQRVENYVGDTNEVSNTVINAGDNNRVSNTVVNTGDENYVYENESLTYKTENNVSEKTEVGGEQKVENYVGDSSRVSNTVINAGDNNRVSNTVVNTGDNHEASDTVVNVSDENYGYENESLTYKTENNVSEKTEVGGEQTVENYAGDSSQVSKTVENGVGKGGEFSVVVVSVDEN